MLLCSTPFSYKIARQAAGGGHSAYFLNDSGAVANAHKRARANLHRALHEDIEAVACPACGIYQPDMVQLLRKQHGKACDPNEHAAERAAVPLRKAWSNACAANTVEAFTRLKLVWPTLSWHADQHIRQIKYPPHMRKLVASVGWIACGVLFAFIVGISIGRM